MRWSRGIIRKYVERKNWKEWRLDGIGVAGLGRMEGNKDMKGRNGEKGRNRGKGNWVRQRLTVFWPRVTASLNCCLSDFSLCILTAAAEMLRLKEYLFICDHYWPLLGYSKNCDNINRKLCFSISTVGWVSPYATAEYFGTRSNQPDHFWPIYGCCC